MKKFFVLVGLIIFCSSCSVDDDGLRFRYELSPIVDVEIPDTFEFGFVYDIPITYLRESSCHGFEGFENIRRDSTRTVAVVSTVIEDDTCEPLLDDLRTVSFPFEVLFSQTYVFNFYQGDDENGEPIYLTKMVPVKE
ncbi:hypothetical protein [Croceiramulus getboli]|nr:hypothetical protein P8624_04265 [Flavobacteriaceae bacterium YJPT1-3]